jgi:hypothetical protein
MLPDNALQVYIVLLISFFPKCLLQDAHLVYFYQP